MIEEQVVLKIELDYAEQTAQAEFAMKHLIFRGVTIELRPFGYLQPFMGS